MRLQRRKSRRVQRAGYKYTRNAKRGAWINSVSWSSPLLLNLLKEIPWDQFEYKGEVVHSYDLDTNENEGFGIGGPTKPPRTIPGTITHSDKPYEIFGGAGCELWSTIFPTPPIRSYVDPSADIDIVIQPFRFKVLPTGNRHLNKVYKSLAENQDAVQEILLTVGDRYTAFGDAYTSWLFDQTVAYCRKIAKSFQQSNLTVPEKENTKETAIADKVEIVGPLLITRTCQPNKGNCKIQVSTKVTRANVVEANHLLEFLVRTEESVNSYPEKPFQVRGFFVQSPYGLLLGQVQGLKDRGLPYIQYLREHPEIPQSNIPKADSFYKSENHCGRILWLLQICQQAERVVEHGQPVFRQVSVGQLEYILSDIVRKNLFSLCTFTFGEDYIEKLFQIADTFTGVRPGHFSAPDSPARARVLALRN